LLDLKKWRPRFAKKHMKTFIGGHTKKGLSDLCGREFVGTIAQKTFREVCGNSGKNPSKPPKFACS